MLPGANIRVSGKLVMTIPVGGGNCCSVDASCEDVDGVTESPPESSTFGSISSASFGLVTLVALVVLVALA